MRWLTLVVLILATWSIPARAGRRAEVAVVGVHVQGMDDDAAIMAAYTLVKALEASDKLEPVEPGRLRAQLAGREQLVVEDAFLGPGRKALEEGRVLYGRADLEAAVPVLAQAVSALKDGLPGATDDTDLIDALVLLGLAEAGMGETDGARAAFKEVVTMDPHRQLDEVKYPPKMVALFNEVREQVLALPPARLVVQGDMAAQVFVDARSVGKTPLTVDNLPPGTHFLLIVGPKGARQFEKIDLSPQQSMVVEPHLKGRYLTRSASSAEDRARQTGLIYQSLGEHITSPLVLLGGETGQGRVALQLYEPRTHSFSKAVEADESDDPVAAMVDLVPALAAFISDEGTLRPDRVSPRVLPLDPSANPLLASMLLDPEPIVQVVTLTKAPPWYAWAAVGVAAAGAAGGAALLLGGGGQTSTPPPNQGTIIVGPYP